MKLTIKEDILKEPLKMIKGLISEANLITTEEGLEIVSWNKANCAAVIYKVSKNLFTEYLPSEEKIGVSLVGITVNKKRRPGLVSILQKAMDGSFITIEEDKGTLAITVNGRKYGMGVIADITAGDKFPDLKFKAVFNIETEQISDLVNDSFMSTEESMLFTFKENKLSVSYDEDLNTLKDSIEVSDVGEAEETHCRYSISYLKVIVSKITEKVRWSYGEDYPLRLEYVAPEFSLTFLLAPRVPNT